jgi:hypothetical protein
MRKLVVGAFLMSTSAPAASRTVKLGFGQETVIFDSPHLSPRRRRP